MVALMEPKLVKLQVPIRDITRRNLKIQGATWDLEMGPMADVLLEYALAQLASNKPPKELTSLITKAQEDKAAREAEEPDPE
jgi:hypothetical protein